MVELPLSVVETHLPEHLKTETAVLQGAMDCVFEEDGALVIVDFKTDRIVKQCERTVGTLPSAIGTVRIRNGTMLRKACKRMHIIFIPSRSKSNGRMEGKVFS